MRLLERWRERRREKRADREAIAREQLDELPVGEDPQAGFDRVRNANDARHPELRR